MMTRDQIQRALVLLGHQSKYWGPDQSSYAAFAAGWPSANGPCPTEAELQTAWDNRPPDPKPTVLSWGAFTARFTEGELDAATNHIYAVNTTTGAPLRPRLQQALARATANDRVDLTSPTTASVLDDMVAGGVITSQRKTEILTP